MLKREGEMKTLKKKICGGGGEEDGNIKMEIKIIKWMGIGKE